MMRYPCLYMKVLLILLLGILGCSKTEDIKGKDVLFVLIDTLRADFLPMYGANHAKTPFLQEIANQSYLFERAIAPSSWTAPSTASLFTSLFPSQHGVLTGFFVSKRLQEKTTTFKFNKIPKNVPTLPELFKRKGYTTLGAADNMNIGAEFGFDRGFDKLITLQHKTAPELNKAAIKLLESADPKNPIFFYLHYMDPHSPYRARAPWFVGETDNKNENAIRKYKSEIEFVDHHFKEFFNKFPRLKDAMIIVTADHGEQFWEHGERGHGKTLYRQETHIPLFIKFPNQKKQTRIHDPVSLVDILPTFSELLGDKPDPRWVGESLIPLMKNKKREVRSAYSELLLVKELGDRANYRSILVDDNHIFDRLDDQDDRLKVFSWKNDQAQKNPALINQDDWAAEFLKSYVKRLQALVSEEGEMVLDEEHIERIKTLGYVM